MDRRLRVGDMPAEMPDRTLRLAGRRQVGLVEQHNHSVRREQRRMPAPVAFAGARELSRVKLDRRLGIDRVQMQMMKARTGEHRDHSPSQMMFATMRRSPPKSTPQ